MSNAPLKPWDSFNPKDPRRLPSAVRELDEILSDGQWHDWQETVALLAGKHDLKPATLSNVIHQLVRRGQVLREGVHRKEAKTRRIRKADQSSSDEEVEARILAALAPSDSAVFRGWHRAGTKVFTDIARECGLYVEAVLKSADSLCACGELESELVARLDNTGNEKQYRVTMLTRAELGEVPLPWQD